MVPARAAEIICPTFIAAGDAGPVWMLNASEALAGAIVGAQRVILFGQTHGVDPQVLAGALQEFVTA